MLRVAVAALLLSTLSAIGAPSQSLGPVRQLGEPFTAAAAGAPTVFNSASGAVFWAAPTLGTTGRKFIGRRIDLDGLPIDTPVTIAESDRSSPLLAASDGSGFLLVADRRAFTTEQFVEIYSLTPDLRGVTRAPDLPGLARALIFNGVDYVLVSIRRDAASDRYDLWVSRLSRDGHLLGETAVPGAWAMDASVAWNGVDYVVAWSEGTGVSVAVLNASLQLTGLSYRLLPSGRLPSVVWTGSAFVLIYSALETGSVETVRVDPSSASISARTRLFAGGATVLVTQLAAAWNGRTITVAFLTIVDDHALYVAQLDSSGKPLPDVSLVRQVGYFSHPAVFSRAPGSALLLYAGPAPPVATAIFAQTVKVESTPILRRAVRR